MKTPSSFPLILYDSKNNYMRVYRLGEKLNILTYSTDRGSCNYFIDKLNYKNFSFRVQNQKSFIHTTSKFLGIFQRVIKKDIFYNRIIIDNNVVIDSPYTENKDTVVNNGLNLNNLLSEWFN